MNRDSLLQALRVHILRMCRQHGGSFSVGCTVDELVGQVECVLSTDKPDFGFADALAHVQRILAGGNHATTTTTTTRPATMTMMEPPTSMMPRRRGSIGSAGSISEIIDAEAMVSRHTLKTFV